MAVFLMLLLFVLLPGVCQASNFRELDPPGLSDGAGIWANIWNYPDGDLDSYCSNLKEHGIANLFIQTSRSNTEAIKYPDELGDLIETCHRHGIRVVAWSYAELVDPKADAEKMIAAALFQSPHGDRLDAIAPNLEKNLAADKVETYCKQLRQALGANYPMVAVVYSPLNRAPEVARIPWKILARYFDVIAPMSYWNSKYQRLDPFTYTVSTCQKVRELTGRADIEIHVIGDGMGTRAPSILEFLRGCKTAEATSASLYPNQKTTAEQLASLARYGDYFQPNSRFRLASFRQMLKSHALAGPDNYDPSQLLSRGDFFRLVVKHLQVGDSSLALGLPGGSIPLSTAKGDLSPSESGQILIAAGLVVPDGVPPSQSWLSAAVYPREAFALLAQIVESKRTDGLRKRADRSQRRADRWFAAPVMAESAERQPASPGQKPLNFLDAAQMVLEAGSAMH